jgi:hypothetical protein
MKKRYVVLFLAQTIVIIVLFIFSFIQKREADNATDRARMAQLVAEQQRQLAMMNEQKASEAAAHCQREIALCLQAKK